MVSLLRLIWGALSRLVPGAVAALTNVTTLFAAAHAVKVGVVAAAISAFVLWVPMPSFVAAIPSLVGQIPESVVYVMEYARVAEGVAIILGAYVVRFLARLALRALS